MGAVHGLKYWYHTSSKDLVHWQNEGVGIHPDTIYDNKGVHSGSGFSTDEKLYLFIQAITGMKTGSVPPIPVWPN